MKGILKFGGLAIATALAIGVLSPGRGTAGCGKPIEVKQVYHVYAYTCMRQVKLLGTYDNLQEACWATMGFRTNPNRTVEITTGTKGQYLYTGPSGFTVYRCSDGVWQSAGKATTREKADAMAAAIRKEGDFAQVVTNFTPKA